MARPLARIEPTPTRPGAVDTPAAAAALFRPLLAQARRERMWAAYLDGEYRLIGVRPIAAGDAQAMVLPLAGLLRGAITDRAANLLVAHGHPGGDPLPSRTDVRTTRRLHEAAVAVGIRLLDHLIVARGGEWRSFRLMGLL